MYQIKVRHAYDDFSLDVEVSLKSDESLVVIGPSGCGKSTLLNMIAGFEIPDYGLVKTPSGVLTDTENNQNVAIHLRHVGYVHQTGCLFSHLSVLENMCYGIKRGQKVNQEKLAHYIDIFELKDCMKREISQLSGGEKQRVAIIRALMSEPEILLFDEVFSALDRLMRKKLRKQVNMIRKELNIPMIFVTHDLAEGYELADRIAVMKKGRILDSGNVQEIFYQPKNSEVAKFIGIRNIIEINGDEDNEYEFLGNRLELSGRNNLIQIGVHQSHIKIVDGMDEGIKVEVIKIDDHVAKEIVTVKTLDTKESIVVENIKSSGFKSLSLGDRISVKVAKDDILIFQDG